MIQFWNSDIDLFKIRQSFAEFKFIFDSNKFFFWIYNWLFSYDAIFQEILASPESNKLFFKKYSVAEVVICWNYYDSIAFYWVWIPML